MNKMLHLTEMGDNIEYINVCVMGGQGEKKKKKYLKKQWLKTPQIYIIITIIHPGCSMNSTWDEFKEIHKHTHHSSKAENQSQGQNFESSNRKLTCHLQVTPDKIKS